MEQTGENRVRLILYGIYDFFGEAVRPDAHWIGLNYLNSIAHGKRWRFANSISVINWCDLARPRKNCEGRHLGLYPVSLIS